jgi:membrane protein
VLVRRRHFLVYILCLGFGLLVVTLVAGALQAMGQSEVQFLWALLRHVLFWYFGTLSQISTVYGSLTTSIAVVGSPPC